MRYQLITYLRGHVKLKVRGETIESLLNELIQFKIKIWNVKRLSEGMLEFHIHLNDFFKLRPLLKKTGCRMTVVKRYGAPFFLNKIMKRQFFISGIALFLAGIFILSTLIWNVEVIGNERLTSEDILEEAEDLGLYKYQFKFKMDNLDLIAKELTKRLPETSWVGVELKGTKIQIKVVESTIPEEEPLYNPRNLISTSDAIITKIFAEQGNPMVKVNHRVKKGDILISGVLGDEENQEIVVAKGEVKGLVWYEYNLKIPLKQEVKIYTGNVKDRKYLVLGNRAIKINGFGDLEFSSFENQLSRHMLSWREYPLHIGWIDEKVLESNLMERNLSIEEAKAVGIQQAKSDILFNTGIETAIVEENIIEADEKDGMIYMQILFEVEQNITTEQPITEFNEIF
ncbi:sporulation protein YqfD [Chengkuizengella axinellae]|uniref:Sporulation protein YqfD n=1 Tax=Chengkuizengella axinellae TaxID=3064388 RepID=A0ABT9IUR3_9BACL|nr:sporulation protein YqfD [Chengkuizengella sp. 2205SS18-9]MDP5273094.1 sporulation protein YqfD [Chengkuizengella sp. 2205SS18-9]